MTRARVSCLWQSSERQHPSGLLDSSVPRHPCDTCCLRVHTTRNGEENLPFKNFQHCSTSPQGHTTSLSLLPAGLASQRAGHYSVNTVRVHQHRGAAALPLLLFLDHWVLTVTVHPGHPCMVSDRQYPEDKRAGQQQEG